MTNKIGESLSKNVEDYLKALFYLTIEKQEAQAGTNQLADHMGLAPASVNGMLKKLRIKGLVDYEKYGKLELTEAGKTIAIRLVRRHRLWETFLHNHMNFEWEEVHEVAEQLEHIRSAKLIEELDRFLGFPERDPHGSIIPGSDGDYRVVSTVPLSEMHPGERCRLVSVKDGSAAFLKYVSQIGLALSSVIEVVERREFDDSIQIAYNDRKENVSRKFAENVFVSRVKNEE